MPTSDAKLLHILVEPELREKLDNYRYAHRYPTLAEAVRVLLRTALENSSKSAAETA